MGRFVLRTTSGELTAPNGVENSEGGAMSDEYKDEETEVEGHVKPAENDEQTDETEVEAHMPRQAQPRQGQPRQG
jgi:hypothetical protein